MRKRVAEYRRQREEEYEKFSQESWTEIEMIEYLANEDPASIDRILRSIDDLIDKFRDMRDSTEGSAVGVELANQMRDSESVRRNNLEVVKGILNEKISEFLFVKKNQIVGKYDRLKRVLDEMRNDDFSWVDEVGDRNRWERILNEIDTANSELSMTAKRNAQQTIHLEQSLFSACQSMLHDKAEHVEREIAQQLHALKSEMDSDIQFRAKKFESIRRRTLIAVEKRIWDIQHGAAERKHLAVSEIATEYREELLKIFTRFLNELARDVDDTDIAEAPRIDLETMWNRRNPASVAYRVKFIQIFLERFGGDPILARQLHNVLTQH